MTDDQPRYMLVETQFQGCGRVKICMCDDQVYAAAEQVRRTHRAQTTPVLKIKSLALHFGCYACPMLLSYEACSMPTGICIRAQALFCIHTVTCNRA